MTAVMSVQAMLQSLIQADPGLDALLSGKKAYVGKVPTDASLNYVVMGQTGETGEGAGYYRHPGHLGTENLHCWAKSKYTANLIFARLAELLDRQRPVLSGHTVMRGTLEYVTDAEGPPEGPDMKSKSWQVWARYRVRSLVAA